MTQKEQAAILSKFRVGGYNTLVATSIGEEGLDIGEVDLIVFFDVSSSPIRTVQRLGRTGRARSGRCVVLVNEGSEADSFQKAFNTSRALLRALQRTGRGGAPTGAAASAADKIEFAPLDATASKMIPHGIVPQVKTTFSMLLLFDMQ